MDVKCPSCKKVYFETTDKYNPDVKANASMVILKDPWKKWKWAPFGDVPASMAYKASRKWFEMYCPGCKSRLAPKGFLTIAQPKPKNIPVAIDIVDGAPVTVEQAIAKYSGVLSNETIEKMFNIQTDMELQEIFIPVIDAPKDTITIINPDNFEIKQPPLDEKTIRDRKIVELKESGMSNAAIGREVGISGMAVGNILKKVNGNDSK